MFFNFVFICSFGCFDGSPEIVTGLFPIVSVSGFKGRCPRWQGWSNIAVNPRFLVGVDTDCFGRNYIIYTLPDETCYRIWSQDGAEDGSHVACSGKTLQFFVCFILLFYVLDVVSITVYDRDTLLNIGSSVAQRKPDFEFLNAGGLFTDTASELFVWVAQSRKRCRRRKRGKRAGILVRLRRRAFRHPLPTILLANVQSLYNKLCELRARISYQRETRDCCVICLTETWMSAMVPDSAIELTGFSLHRSDRTKELTGKSRGGGVCFYINNS